jgi:hypothetical protein
MRGRGNNGGGNNPNRKGPNPLTRNYESNGPDVKIRGSAQQIAEKYTTLARDAQSSGDRVMAENYLQHAEHYNRIIAAAQAQMPIQHQVQHNRDDFSDDHDEDRDEFENAGTAAQGNAPSETQPQPVSADVAPISNGSGPQPIIEGTPAEVALNSEGSPNGGGRHRERRPQQPRNARPEAGAAAEAASPEASQVNGNDGEEGEQNAAPRRSRRPRRGERRSDQTAEAGSADGESAGDAGQATPTPEASGGDAVPAPVES